MRAIQIAGVCLIGMTVSFSSIAMDESQFQVAAEHSFEKVVQNYKIPGLIVGVTQNGRHHFYAVGFADREKKRSVTPDTLFELGSISKVFNATLAALAEQRGQIALTDTVSHYLCADQCSIGDDLTLMDLATHHSGGLPLQVPDDIDNTEQLIVWLQAWKPTHPGFRSYSNISIGMLGFITAKAMGTTYTQAVQEILFPSLGLNNTWIEVPPEKMAQYAYGYDRRTDLPIRVTPGVLDAEAYGVKSSAGDMLKLLDLVLGHGNASKEIKAAIARTQDAQYKTAHFTQDMIWEYYECPVNLESMVAGNSGDFIFLPQPVEPMEKSKSVNRNIILNKTGSTNGFSGYVAVLPKRNIGMVVLANRNFPNEERVRATYSLIRRLVGQ